MTRLRNTKKHAVCKGAELLFPYKCGRCPIDKFKKNQFSLKPQTWTRVCMDHKSIVIPKERIISIHFQEIVSLTYENASEYVNIMLNRVSLSKISFHIVIVSSLINSNMIDKTKTFHPSGECLIIESTIISRDETLDKLKNCSSIILNALPYKEDVEFRQCNAHKRICLANNFLIGTASTTSCSVGKNQHHRRSNKSRRKLNCNTNKLRMNNLAVLHDFPLSASDFPSPLNDVPISNNYTNDIPSYEYEDDDHLNIFLSPSSSPIFGTREVPIVNEKIVLDQSFDFFPPVQYCDRSRDEDDEEENTMASIATSMSDNTSSSSNPFHIANITLSPTFDSETFLN